MRSHRLPFSIACLSAPAMMRRLDCGPQGQMSQTACGKLWKARPAGRLEACFILIGDARFSRIVARNRHRPKLRRCGGSMKMLSLLTFAVFSVAVVAQSSGASSDQPQAEQ